VPGQEPLFDPKVVATVPEKKRRIFGWGK
jgi:hypothetical protein